MTAGGTTGTSHETDPPISTLSAFAPQLRRARKNQRQQRGSCACADDRVARCHSRSATDYIG